MTETEAGTKTETATMETAGASEAQVKAADPRLGVTVTHRRYVPYSHAHYGGNLVDGAYVLSMFGDVATELAIRTDGDESLLAGYESVELLAPVHGGDVLEASATVIMTSPAPLTAGSDSPVASDSSTSAWPAATTASATT